VEFSGVRRALAGMFVMICLAGVQAVAQVPSTQASPRIRDSEALAPAAIASYDNRWEVYGGLNLANGQAGQNIAKRYNAGGTELMGTYWLTPKLGVAGDYRFEGGTSPVLPTPYYNRVAVFENVFMGGAEYRGPKGRYAALTYHAFAGIAHGDFDSSVRDYPGGSPISAQQVGLYTDSNSPYAAAGASLDFNASARLAIRIQPDLTFEHYGTETREFFSFSMGALYRFGHR
jgi:hypothetical protein